MQVYSKKNLDFWIKFMKINFVYRHMHALTGATIRVYARTCTFLYARLITGRIMVSPDGLILDRPGVRHKLTYSFPLNIPRNNWPSLTKFGIKVHLDDQGRGN